MDDYLTAQQVGARLGLTTGRIFQMAIREELPSKRIGSARIFPRAEFEAWVMEWEAKRGERNGSR